MRVMAGMSAGSAERMAATMIATPDSRPGARARRAWAGRKRQRPGGPGRCAQSKRLDSASVAQESQHEQEEVDEVQVERERAHHRLAADDRAILHRVIHLLDTLRVPGGQARKNEHTGRG